MKVFFKHSTISVEFGHTKFLAILYNDRYNKNHTNEKEGKTLEKSIEVYGNIEIKDELDEKINNPIQVVYERCNIWLRGCHASKIANGAVYLLSDMFSYKS